MGRLTRIYFLQVYPHKRLLLTNKEVITMSDEKDNTIDRSKLPRGRKNHDAKKMPKGHGLTCGAKKKNGEICMSSNLYENGRCVYHGGASTGPKNGTGRLSKLDHTLFTEEELNYIEENPVTNIEQQLLSEIEIITIRERRMLRKIQEMKTKEWHNQERIESLGKNGQQVTKNTELVSVGTEVLMQKIEADLTKVQHQKMKLLNSLAHYRSTLTQNNNIDVSIFVNAIKGQNNLWEDDKNDESEDGTE
jgi:hypothetical protein